MKVLTPVAVFATLSLSACAEPTTNTDATQQASERSPASTATISGDGKTIPAAFRGVWAATENDCVKPAETRMEIGADRIQLYESSGPVASTKSTGPGEVHIVVSLTGEGATSQRSFRYRLIEDGSALFDVRNGLVRQRCPTA